MQCGAIVIRHIIGMAIAGRFHTQRLEKLFVGEFVPWFMRCRCNRLRADGRAEIRIMIGGAERIERQLLQAGYDVVAFEAEVFEIVARRARQTAAMCKEIPDGSVFGLIVVVQFETGKMFCHRIVPRNHALRHLNGSDSRGYGFRNRSDLEHGVGIDGGVLADFPFAVAFRKHGLAAADHGDRHAGNMAALHDVGHDLRQGLERLFGASFRNLHDIGSRIGLALNGNRLRQGSCRAAEHEQTG